MFLSLLDFARRNSWLAVLFCLVPVLLYIWVFQSIALNVNYIAFDDILILGVIPGFSDAGWLERWQRLTELFPEHRLVFSRSVILLLYGLFGRINLVWPMIIANMCWAGCAVVFYRAFLRLRLSVWYFVPIVWIWFNIQSFENIFWAVSSLCNFGVLLFVLSALYFAVYDPARYYVALLLAVAATFSYGNGLMVFPVIAMISLLTGHKKNFIVTVVLMLMTAAIYFIDFTPITQNLDLSNAQQVKEGFLGYFGFIGSIATLSAYNARELAVNLAVAFGFVLILSLLFLYGSQWKPLWRSVFGKDIYTNREALFALSITVFVAITALALVYKRIPTDGFEGMFKGRYRMYSTLWCVALYMSYLALMKPHFRVKSLSILLPLIICLNLIILHGNFAQAVNNRRQAIVQEFNARYNADWLGLHMFKMEEQHYEKIRAYYQSEDPLAKGWNPRSKTDSVSCEGIYLPETVIKDGSNIHIYFAQDVFKVEKDYSDGAYVLLKSADHVYASPANQTAVPLKTTLRRLMYFSKGVYGDFHAATVEPGLYRIYLLVRSNGTNKIYCTGKTWKEER